MYRTTGCRNEDKSIYPLYYITGQEKQQFVSREGRNTVHNIKKLQHQERKDVGVQQHPGGCLRGWDEQGKVGK